MTQPDSVPTDLAHRYGAKALWRRRVSLAVVAVIAVVFLVWVAWVAWFHSTPAAKSSLVGFEITSDRTAEAHVQVQLDDDAAASCRLRAFAEDHTTVGEVSFAPTPGRNDVVVRTERRATSVELIGCTTADQQRPR